MTLEAFLARKPVITRTRRGRAERVRRSTASTAASARPSPEAHGRGDRRGSPPIARRAAAMGDAGHDARAHDHLGRRHREAAAMRRSPTRCRSSSSRSRASTRPQTLPATLADLPRPIPGIDVIEVLVIDDGSRDGTSDVARAHGVDHVVRLPPATRGWRRRSWPASTRASSAAPTSSSTPTPTISTSAHDIPQLLAPLLRGEADIVIGDRNIARARSTCRGRKRRCSALGSWVVRQVSNTTVPDTTSGFRAYTREAALRMTIVSEFSYTLESIIQAGKKRMAIAHVAGRDEPAHARVAAVRQRLLVHQAVGGDDRPDLRDVRAAEGLHLHRRAPSSRSGFAISLRFVYYYFTGTGRPAHVQSLILSAVLMIVGFQVLLIGLVADVISGNRKLLEDLLYRVRSLELDRERDARPTPSSRTRRAGALEHAWPTPPRLGRHSRLQRSRRHRRGRRARSRPRRRGTRSSSSTTDRRDDDRRARRRAAGATVVRHPYNKGNGAAVKTGIRARDRRVRPHHRRRRPASARRRAAAREPRSASTISSSARDPTATQATHARRLGNGAAQPARQLSDGARRFPI